MTFKSIFKQRGFSLVEIMVAVGLVGGVSLGVTKLIQNMSQGQSQVEAKDDLRTLSQLISTILSNSESCKMTFNDFVVDPASAAETLSSTGLKLDYVNRAVPVPTKMYIAGEKFGKLTIINYFLKNYDDAKKTAQFEIVTTFRKSAEIEMTRSQRLAMNMDIDLVAGTVTQCSSASAGEEGIWQLMDIPLMGIFYNQGSVLIGSGAADTSSATPAMAFGVDNFVYGSASIATGKNNSITSIANESAAFGTSNQLNGASTFAIGSDNNVGTADPDGNNAIAIGYSNFVSKRYGMAIGLQNSVSVEGGLAIGNYSSSIGGNSFALGTVAEASGAYSLAFGNDITASGEKSVAIGYDSSAVNESSIAIGDTSFANGGHDVVIGKQSNSANAGGQNVVIGAEAMSAARRTVVIGKNAGVEDESSTGSIGIGMAARVVNASQGAIAFGQTSSVSANFAVGIGTATNVSGISAVGIGNSAIASADHSVALGEGSSSAGTHAVAIGHASSSSAHETVSIGHGANSNAPNAISLGSNAVANGELSIAIGQASTSPVERSIAIGGSANSAGQNSIAIGYSAISSDNDSMAIGYLAEAKAHGAVVIASNAQNDVPDSVLIAQSSLPHKAKPSDQGILALGFKGGIEICLNAAPADQVCDPADMFYLKNVSDGWKNPSDKNLKKDFKDVNKQDILTNLMKMQLTTWMYKKEEKSNKRNLGPMAQDFYRLFVKPLGIKGDDKSLSINQLTMVNTLAAQALNEKVIKLEKENKDLKTEMLILREAVCDINPKAKVCHQ